MTSEFRMSPASGTAAMERIIESLTDRQQMALVTAFRQPDGYVRVAANEWTIGSLLRGNGPLIQEVGAMRVLTPLGQDVARYLKEEKKFSALPDISTMIPELPKPDQQ